MELIFKFGHAHEQNERVCFVVFRFPFSRFRLCYTSSCHVEQLFMLIQ